MPHQNIFDNTTQTHLLSFVGTDVHAQYIGELAHSNVGEMLSYSQVMKIIESGNKEVRLGFNLNISMFINFNEFDGSSNNSPPNSVQRS